MSIWYISVYGQDILILRPELSDLLFQDRRQGTPAAVDVAAGPDEQAGWLFACKLLGGLLWGPLMSF